MLLLKRTAIPGHKYEPFETHGDEKSQMTGRHAHNIHTQTDRHTVRQFGSMNCAVFSLFVCLFFGGRGGYIQQVPTGSKIFPVWPFTFSPL